MANHSSILAWRIPWTEEPGGLHTIHGVAKSWTHLSNCAFTLKHSKSSYSFFKVNVFNRILGFFNVIRIVH